MAKKTTTKKNTVAKKNKVTKKDVRFIKLNKNIEMPTFTKQPSDKFPRFGDDNKFPELILKYYDSVGLHRAIIAKKLNLFLGDGFIINSDDEKLYEKTLKFVNEINPFENLSQLISKIGLDMFLYKGSYIQIIWSKDGKKITQVFHMPYQKMRSAFANKYGIVEEYYFNPSDVPHEKWTTYTDLNKVEKFPAFNTNKYKGKAQILFIHDEEPSNMHYPLPDWIGCIKDLDTLAAISDFHNANIHNNMQPGFTVIMKGEPSDDEQDEIVKQIQSKYSDTENSGKPMVFFIDKEDEITITPMNTSDIGEMYQNLSNDVKENIIVSHQIPRAVSGLMTPGSLGNTKEIVDGIEMVKSSYITQYQNMVINYINIIFNINKLANLSIKNKPISLLGYTIPDLLKALSVNEVRELLGYESAKAQEIEDNIDDENNNEKIDE